MKLFSFFVGAATAISANAALAEFNVTILQKTISIAELSH